MSSGNICHPPCGPVECVKCATGLRGLCEWGRRKSFPQLEPSFSASAAASVEREKARGLVGDLSQDNIVFTHALPSGTNLRILSASAWQRSIVFLGGMLHAVCSYVEARRSGSRLVFSNIPCPALDIQFSLGKPQPSNECQIEIFTVSTTTCDYTFLCEKSQTCMALRCWVLWKGQRG